MPQIDWSHTLAYDDDQQDVRARAMRFAQQRGIRSGRVAKRFSNATR
jgi:predicted AAA+ superfamily ATPase